MSGVFLNKIAAQTVFTPTRSEGLRRLHEFSATAGEYGMGRNFDRPERQAVSQLSPYIRYRLIAEREVVHAVLEEYDFPEVESFIGEVAWRTYWKGYLEMRPGIWKRYLKEVSAWEDDPDADMAFRAEAALNGRSGIECFDFWVRQLRETGYLHNHARMWFASIWIFTLKLPWQAGAAFFLRHLLDGDPASNILSWRWVAGLHTKGKHYLARADNIARFTEGRFNPEGLLEESAAPLPMDGAYEAQPFGAVSSLRDVNFPSLSNCPAGLLVTPDDLSPESGELSETPFCSLCVFAGRDVLDTYNASDKVVDFISDAVEDTGWRLSRHWGGKVVDCNGKVLKRLGRAGPENVGVKEPLRVYSGTVDRWVESVVTWAGNEHLNSVWLMRPPVGPWADVLPQLVHALRMRGVRVFEYRRRWDSLNWPHATGGYFRFREDLQERVTRALARQA